MTCIFFIFYKWMQLICNYVHEIKKWWLSYKRKQPNIFRNWRNWYLYHIFTHFRTLAAGFMYVRKVLFWNTVRNLIWFCLVNQCWSVLKVFLTFACLIVPLRYLHQSQIYHTNCTRTCFRSFYWTINTAFFFI